VSIVRQVEKAIASVPTSSGVIVVGPDGDLLASRDPLRGGGAVLIALGRRPFSYPKRSGHIALDARYTTPRAVAQAGSQGDSHALRGSQPPTGLTASEPPQASSG